MQFVKNVWNSFVVASRWVILLAGAPTIVYEAYALGGIWHGLSASVVLAVVAQAAFSKGETLKF